MPNGSPPPLPSVTPPAAARLFREVRFDRVHPDRTQVCRLVGLREGHANHRRWFDLVDQLLADLTPILRPRGMFRVDEVDELTGRRVALRSGAVFDGNIGRILPQADLVATFIVTIGSAAERLSRWWLKAGQSLPGTIVDAIASEAAEATAQRLEDEVRTWAREQGLEITPRFSPGYCGIPLEQQRGLFAGLPAERINVRLTPSCLMLPLKSVSGLIGIAPAERVGPRRYPCELCEHPDCLQRRAPYAG